MRELRINKHNPSQGKIELNSNNYLKAGSIHIIGFLKEKCLIIQSLTIYCF